MPKLPAVKPEIAPHSPHFHVLDSSVVTSATLRTASMMLRAILLRRDNPFLPFEGEEREV